jgi:hypothetical protein
MLVFNQNLQVQQAEARRAEPEDAQQNGVASHNSTHTAFGKYVVKSGGRRISLANFLTRSVAPMCWHTSHYSTNRWQDPSAPSLKPTRNIRCAAL